MSARFGGRVAVVVGAGVGIGRATARRLAVDGARVVVADLNEDAASAVADAMARSGAVAIAARVDVRDDESVRQLMRSTARTFGRIDIVHNNVASPVRNTRGGDADLVEIGLDAWDEALRVNVRGMMLGCRHAIPHLLAAGGGAIVNTASISGLVGEAHRAAYPTSKAALIGLTRHVAQRWGKQGIRCNAVAPGLTLTEMALQTLPESARETALQRVPSPRLATPDDIAAIVAFLASEDSYYIQGQVIVADGGATSAGTR